MKQPALTVISRLLAAFAIAFVIDGLTKFWVEQVLTPYQPVPVIGEWFRLTLGYNTGVAFGMLSNGGQLPMILTGVIIIIIGVWFMRGLASGHFAPIAAWPVGLLLGGAIGNFIDRLYDGRVTDFLDAGIGATRWPTFNLADAFILTGVGILMLLSFFSEEPRSSEPPPGGPPAQNEPFDQKQITDTF
jgi:signal peptidase II